MRLNFYLKYEIFLNIIGNSICQKYIYNKLKYMTIKENRKLSFLNCKFFHWKNKSRIFKTNLNLEKLNFYILPKKR